MRLPVLLIAAVLADPLAASAQAPVGRITDQKPVAGTTIKIAEESATTHRVLLGDRVLYVDRDDPYVTVQGVYEADGHAFALIGESSGGSGCASMYRAVDVTTRGLVSPQFGTCSDVPREVRLDGDALVIVLPSPDGQANEVFRYAAGKLTRTVQPIVYNPGGPASAPHGDLAALLDGKYIFDAVNMRLVADALRPVMGDATFTASRKRIQGGTGMPFESRGEFVFGMACEAHRCGINETAWAFDHFGHAWASWTQNGRTTFFGNPPPAVRAALSR